MSGDSLISLARMIRLRHLKNIMTWIASRDFRYVGFAISAVVMVPSQRTIAPWSGESGSRGSKFGGSHRLACSTEAKGLSRTDAQEKRKAAEGEDIHWGNAASGLWSCSGVSRLDFMPGAPPNIYTPFGRAGSFS